MGKVGILIILGVLIESVHCQWKHTQVSEFGSDLGMKIFNHVVNSNPTENTIMSPHGITSVLGMLQLGAGARTRQQLNIALKYNSYGIYKKIKKIHKSLTESRNQDIVTIANGLFAPSDFAMEQSFLRKIQVLYQAAVRNVHYENPVEAASTINLWTRNQTRGMITNLISPSMLSETTRLVVVNALFFKGLWKSRFLPENTRNRDFYAADGSVYQVPMMSQKATFSFGMAITPTNVKYYILELPYHGGTISMFVVVPEEYNIPLSTITPHLDIQSIHAWKRIMREKKLDIALPKFTAEAEIDLERPLSALGITDMFDRTKANFGKICRSGELYVSQVLQKAKIEVNEDGTKASAATAAVMMVKSLRIIPSFVVNRPFIYIIWHNPSGTVLFIGQVSRP
ncbi:glia-derived nexin [Hemiscyllium ocellatum]|uniref:glia-derived nexin n=1 Tax=Hemiscyllium ocellatum TaxID=170820 RepID=UPI00296681A6|nr:glia-derived nexin [Hemiscyllium ocellatum]XP_060690199.1 glia-derived nexin [Hemiscyllium ocellatum]XP_060690200.1 glia-derived nexin [Hemiscyllium ocellatum]